MNLARIKLASVLAGAAAVAGGGLLVAPVAQAQGKPVSFHNDIQPLLARKCGGCHQPASRAGKLSVSTFAQLKSGGIAGAAFVPGKPADSPLYKMISGKAPMMPKDMPPLTAKEQETIRLWIVQGAHDDTPEPKDSIDAQHPPVYAAPPVLTAVAYSPDGDTLAVSGYREIVLSKADGSGTIARLVGRSQRIESVAFSPDGKLLAAVGGTSCRFGEFQLWDVAEKKLLKSVEIGFDVLYGVSFSPDGKTVAFGGAEKSVYLYTVPDVQQVMKFDNHSDWVFGTTFSKDSKNVISTSRDRAIKLIEIATKNFVDDINYQVYNGGYFAVARNPMTDEVAVGGEEGIVRYYSIFKVKARTMNREDYNLLRTFDKVDGPIYTLAFNADGSMLAVGGRFNEIRIFKTADGSKIASLKGFSGSIHSLAWHPKKPELTVAGFDGTIRTYAVPGGDVLHAFVPVPVTRGQRVTKAN
jgi:WD40 repeat protein